MTKVDTIEVNTIDWHLLTLKLAIVSTTEVDILTSTIQEPAPRYWQPVVMAESPPIVSVDSKRRGFASSNQVVNGWIACIGEKLYSIPSVEDIFVSIEDSDVDVWVVIPERDLATLHQIVEREGELFDTLVSGENPPFLMDFHVMYRCGRNIEELVSNRAVRIPQQA